MVAAAVIGSAVVGAAVSSNASKKAASTQAGAADRAAGLQDEQYWQTRQDQLDQLKQQRADTQPYRDAGMAALSQLSGGTAAGGEFNRNFNMSDFQADPGAQFRLSQGEQGINRAATASGSRYSGATLKALSRFNSDLASQEYGAAYSRFNTDTGNRFNRLSSLAGTGQTSVAQSGQASQNAYGQIAAAGQANAAGQGAALQNAAAARASGYVGTANAVNNVIGTGVNAYTQQSYLKGMAAPQQVYAAPAGGSAGQYYDGYGWN